MVTRDWGDGQLSFNRYRVSVCHDEQILEIVVLVAQWSECT